jgi:hypothetical protein
MEINHAELASKLEPYIRKDVTILRQVVYKELQEWKRKMFEAYDMGEATLNVAGEAYKLAELSEQDKKWIDTQIEWFIIGELPQDFVLKYAERTYNDLNKQPKLSAAQSDLMNKLQPIINPTAQKEKLKKDLSSDIPF